MLLTLFTACHARGPASLKAKPHDFVSWTFLRRPLKVSIDGKKRRKPIDICIFQASSNFARASLVFFVMCLNTGDGTCAQHVVVSCNIEESMFRRHVWYPLAQSGLMGVHGALASIADALVVRQGQVKTHGSRKCCLGPYVVLGKCLALRLAPRAGADLGLAGREAAVAGVRFERLVAMLYVQCVPNADSEQTPSTQTRCFCIRSSTKTFTSPGRWQHSSLSN